MRVTTTRPVPIIFRFVMKEAADDSTVPSQAVSQLVISIPSVPRKVCTLTTKTYTLLELNAGWAPSTFVSSRNDRAKKQAARPEDFMDEEDLQELKDSRKFVDTADEMDLTGGTQAELQGRQADEPE